MSDALNIPQVNSADTPADFDLLVSKAQALIADLTPLDHISLFKEITDLNIPTTANASLQQMNEEIDRVQAAKDRLATILIESEREFRIKDRCCDILQEGWLKFSSESSADRRKADALVRMAQFVDSAGDSEILYKTAVRIMKNLDDKQGSISRQVTVFQQLLKLRDINRGLPTEGNRSVGSAESVDESDILNWDDEKSQ